MYFDGESFWYVVFSYLFSKIGKLFCFDIKSQEKQYDKKMMQLSYIGLILHHLYWYFILVLILSKLKQKSMDLFLLSTFR